MKQLLFSFLILMTLNSFAQQPDVSLIPYRQGNLWGYANTDKSIVIKPLSKPLDTIDLFGGVTLLGSGQVCLVLDVPALTRLFLAKRP